MAVPVRLCNIPEYLRVPSFADHHDHDTSLPTAYKDPQDMLQFPKSTCILWNGTSIGPSVFLHVAQYRRPRLQLWEKVLWLIHKQLGNSQSTSRVLAGSLSVDDDAEGVCFHIDGLDTRQSNADTSLVLGDVMIPVQVSNSKNQDRTGTAEDYADAIKMLQKRCCSRDTAELNSLLLLKGWCNFYSNQTADKTVAHLQFDVVTLANVFKATPVNPVPIVPTALAKNLGGPRSLSHVQGRPKVGYLTMDHTRKLLLVLESDPKVARLPIVGIWVSGVPMVHHPFVWASCLHYLHNETLQDRVCTPPEGFLLVIYTPLHSKPEFYEMCTVSGKSDLEYDLYTGYEITSLHKKASNPEPLNIEWELTPVRNGPKRELFDAALEGIKSQGGKCFIGISNPVQSTNDDIMPRMNPAPHQDKAVVVKPMVPELSLIWNDDNSSPQPISASQSHPQIQDAAFNAPVSSQFSFNSDSVTTQRCGTEPADIVSASITGSNNNNDYCVSRSEPRLQAGAPARIVHGHSSPSGTLFPGMKSLRVPASFPVATLSSNVNQFTTAYQHCQHLQSFSGIQLPSPHSQGHTPSGVHSGAPAQVTIRTVTQGNFPHQPSQPRMMTPRTMSHCHGNQTGTFVQPIYSNCQPPPVVQWSQQNGPALRPVFNQVQPIGGVPRVPSSHFQKHVMQPSSWPNHSPTNIVQNSVPLSSMTSHSSNLMQKNNTPFTQAFMYGTAANSFSQEYGAQQLPHHSQPQILNYSAQSTPGYPPVTYSQDQLNIASQDGLMQQKQKDSNQVDTTSSSGKSSDDSGLSITPDRSNPSSKSSARVDAFTAADLKSINWAGVPNEVVQLLVQQDAQLKVLQEQIQQLLAQQHKTAASPETPPTSSLAASLPPFTKPETCSTAVNTTLLEPNSCWGRPAATTQCASIQTSPQKTSLSDNHQKSPSEYSHSAGDTFHRLRSPFSQECAVESATGNTQRVSSIHSPFREEEGSAGQTPSEIRHKGTAQLSSTRCEGGIAVGCVHSSDSSEQPSTPVRSTESYLQASLSSPSPQSASMCVRRNEDEEENDTGEVSPDSKEYYDQLINNIHLFLNSHSQEMGSIQINRTDILSDDQTCTHLKLLDSTVAVSPSMPACISSDGSSNITLMPHINYLSLMLSSESDTSVEINAMAMKYLRDEQLTQLARLHQSSPPHVGGTTNHQLLRKVLASLDASGGSDVSRLGLSANNLSMATRKYMEKHGLLGGGDWENELSASQTLHLQTDFSLALLSEPHSLHGSPQEVASPQHGSKQAYASKSPTKQGMLKLHPPESTIAEEGENLHEENSRSIPGNLGASPVLRPSQPRYHFQGPSPGDTPIFPERYCGAQGHNLIDNDSLANDERILDIEKLKQMPKLL